MKKLIPLFTIPVILLTGCGVKQELPLKDVTPTQAETSIEKNKFDEALKTRPNAYGYLKNLYSMADEYDNGNPVYWESVISDKMAIYTDYSLLAPYQMIAFKYNAQFKGNALKKQPNPILVFKSFNPDFNYEGGDTVEIEIPIKPTGLIYYDNGVIEIKADTDKRIFVSPHKNRLLGIEGNICYIVENEIGTVEEGRLFYPISNIRKTQYEKALKILTETNKTTLDIKPINKITLGL